jgi:uncharacterized membrane protein
MLKHKKSGEWVAAGLITEAQAQAIHDYEAARKQGRFGRGLVGVALFAILVGVLSIIAANWSDIPAEVKLGVHALLNLGVGYFVMRADGRFPLLWREAGVLAFLGFTFTFIILIGQIFQMGGDVGGAVIFWFLITLPFFLIAGGRAGLSSVPWILGFLTALYYFIFEKIPLFMPESFIELAAYGAAVLLPAIFAAIGQGSFLINKRPGLARGLFWMGFFFLPVNASITTMILELAKTVNLSPADIILIAAIGAGLGLLHAARYGFYKARPDLKLGAVFVWGSFAVTILATLCPAFDGRNLFMALLFIGYWIFFGIMAQKAGWQRMVSLSIVIIAMRIYGVYLELFGSLMDTGFGLITGGLVMLALIFAARKTNLWVQRGGRGNHG